MIFHVWHTSEFNRFAVL